jgi:hypothetical protein
METSEPPVPGDLANGVESGRGAGELGLGVLGSACVLRYFGDPSIAPVGFDPRS